MTSPPPPPPPEGADEPGADLADLADQDEEDAGFALFSDPRDSRPSLAADGSDPGVLPVALGGTAAVALMVTILIAFNGRLLQPFGVAMVVITLGLAWFAWQTRVERIQVRLSQGGVVYVDRSSSDALRYDLTSELTRVRMSGAPGAEDWTVNFARRGHEDFTVTAVMVDSEEFTNGLRAFRPDL